MQVIHHAEPALQSTVLLHDEVDALDGSCMHAQRRCGALRCAALHSVRRVKTWLPLHALEYLLTAKQGPAIMRPRAQPHHSQHG